MDARAPQAFIGVDVSHPAQDMLVEKQRFDSRVARVKLCYELRFACFERIEA
jgi:hypothetical protein